MADKAQVIAELTVADIPAPLREAIVAEASKQDETQATIAELTNTVTAKDAIISELNSQVETLRLERLSAAIEARVAELTDWQVSDDEGKEKLAYLRKMLRSQIETRLGDNKSAERVAEMADAAWADLKPIAEMMRDVLSGPSARVNGKVEGRKVVEPTREEQRAAAHQLGIAV